MGWTDGIVFENYFLAERVSRSLLGTAEPQGSPAKLIRFVRLWERAARATGRGRGRGRDSRRASPRSFSRRSSRAAPRSAGRGLRENAPFVEKNTFFLLLRQMYQTYICIPCSAGRGSFLALSAAGHTAGAPVYQGASVGPGRVASHALRAFKVASSGK